MKKLYALRVYGLNVLDLMCGKGRSAEVLFKWWNDIRDKRLGRMKKDGTLVLVDISEAMLEEAKSKNYETNPRVITHCRNVKTLDWNMFNNVKFDVVIGWWNLCYLRTPEQRQSYINGLLLVIANGGIVFLCEPVSETPMRIGKIHDECHE